MDLIDNYIKVLLMAVGMIFIGLALKSKIDSWSDRKKYITGFSLLLISLLVLGINLSFNPLVVPMPYIEPFDFDSMHFIASVSVIPLTYVTIAFAFKATITTMAQHVIFAMMVMVSYYDLYLFYAIKLSHEEYRMLHEIPILLIFLLTISKDSKKVDQLGKPATVFVHIVLLSYLIYFVSFPILVTP